MLNKSKGNMYSFCTHTWNTVKGECPHFCEYCFMRKFKLGPRRFDASELKTNLGSGNVIFVGSSNDMFAETVPAEWIQKTLLHCKDYPGNQYLFQSKNPERFKMYMGWFPEHVILGTTIETNRWYGEYRVSYAPAPFQRVVAMQSFAERNIYPMVTIEPIMDFDLEIMVKWMKCLRPRWINIGADSKGHNLPEPTAEKTMSLIEELRKFTQVKVKPNLKRITE